MDQTVLDVCLLYKRHQSFLYIKIHVKYNLHKMTTKQTIALHSLEKFRQILKTLESTGLISGAQDLQTFLAFASYLFALNACRIM